MFAMKLAQVKDEWSLKVRSSLYISFLAIYSIPEMIYVASGRSRCVPRYVIHTRNTGNCSNRRKVRLIHRGGKAEDVCDEASTRQRRVVPQGTLLAARYRGASLIRNSADLGPYSRAMPRVLGRS